MKGIAGAIVTVLSAMPSDGHILTNPSIAFVGVPWVHFLTQIETLNIYAEHQSRALDLHLVSKDAFILRVGQTIPY